MNNQRRNIIYKTIEEAVNDGIRLATKRAAELEKDKFNYFFLPKHKDYPTISYFDSGLPYFYLTSEIFGSKINYAKILEVSKEDITMESWDRFIQLFMTDNDLYNYITHKNWKPPTEERMKEVMIFILYRKLRKLIDSIMHCSSSPNRNTYLKKQKINKWVNALVNPSVNFELIIPIIFSQPDCQKISISNNIRIEKFTETFQLSRHFKLPENVIAHDKVVGAATHGIIISDILKNIPNNNELEKYKFVKKEIDSNIGLISKLFSLLRVAINDSVGYCQVIARPLDFEEEWFADLEFIKIYGYKNYPLNFEDVGWSEKKVISKKQLFSFKKLLKINSNNQKLDLALRKLFESDLREKDEDSVLDISTGLESLLSDSTDNLKYKVSFRSAAICKKKRLFGFKPVEIRNYISKFYDLRSSIIHGNIKKIKKYQRVMTNGFGEVDTLWVGKLVLTHIIEFILMNQEFESVNNIDNFLLE